MSTLIQKTLVEGVDWVEVPSKALKILCGCPADSIKYLIKNGYIQEKKLGNHVYETGPNVILLSEDLFQKDIICNLSEFPILHILYKQCLAIPGHPKNTGEKPILMGIKNQVDSQLEYIFQGNFGFTTVTEYQNIGIDKEFAKQNLRFKLKFAFGKFTPSSELLDTIYIQEKPVEIRDEVFIERIEKNIYRISFQNESVDVNLNISKKYPLPYELPKKSIPNAYFSVTNTGLGDGWNPDLPCFGSIVQFNKKKYLVDTGPNILKIMDHLGIYPEEIDGIFQTHAHDDHFAGLTSLLKINKQFEYYAPKLIRHSVIKKLGSLLQMREEEFYEHFHVHDLEFDQWNCIGKLEVKPLLSPHPIDTAIFIFRTKVDEIYKTYGHFADLSSLETLKGMITENEHEHGIKRELYEKIKQIYETPLNMKKVDIGGGLIHGNAEDFANDVTEFLLLGHTSIPLTKDQLTIGNTCDFGDTHILIDKLAGDSKN